MPRAASDIVSVRRNTLRRGSTKIGLFGSRRLSVQDCEQMRATAWNSLLETMAAASKGAAGGA